MKNLDIDSLDPGYAAGPAILPPKGRKLTKKQAMANARAGYVRIQNIGSWDSRLGIRPETMRDWRGLERRMQSLDEAWRRAHESMWSCMRSFERSDTSDECEGLAIVAISDPATGDDSILKISSDSYSLDTQGRMLTSLISDPNREEAFKFYRYDQGGAELSRAIHRERRSHRAYGTYRLAFERAVIDRLRIEGERRRSGERYYAYFSPAVFVVENEGRQYIFSMDNRGFFARLEGEIFRTEAR